MEQQPRQAFRDPPWMGRAEPAPACTAVRRTGSSTPSVRIPDAERISEPAPRVPVRHLRRRPRAAPGRRARPTASDPDRMSAAAVMMPNRRQPLTVAVRVVACARSVSAEGTAPPTPCLSALLAAQAGGGFNRRCVGGAGGRGRPTAVHRVVRRDLAAERNVTATFGVADAVTDSSTGRLPSRSRVFDETSGPVVAASVDAVALSFSVLYPVCAAERRRGAGG